ncbi:MAG: DUF721 domain-containing protein [Polyangiaceae bacterium]|nr:DUF721 domain-containing protein [Polyangiaceae bacterium]
MSSLPPNPRHQPPPDRPPSTGAVRDSPTTPTLLATLLSDAQRVTAQAARAGPVSRETWRRVVGDRIANRTQVGRLEQGSLEVVVSSPVWAQELAFLSREIVARMHKLGLPVDRVRFRVGAVPALEALATRGSRVAPVALPQDLEASIAAIDDPDLRATVAEAARYSLGRYAASLTTSRSAPGPRSSGPGTDRPGPSSPVSPGATRHRT